jgi:RNA polymerase sigma factor (sigma-70 family)
VNGATDTELLREFVDSHAEAAFNEIVSRYVSLVYSAAVRMVVDVQLAEDVTQSAFVALARNAPEVLRRLRSGVPISAWLHVTTRNIAAKTVRTEERRRAREKEAASMHELNKVEDGNTWSELAPHLDSSLGTLREQDRAILLLRFFEQKTVKEMAANFGAGEEAMQKRLSRAVEALRRSLIRQGVTVPSGALAALLTANTLQPAPATFVAGVAKVALTSANLMAPGTLTLWMKTVGALSMTKTQIAVSVAVVVGLGVPFIAQQSELTEVRAAQTASDVPQARLPEQLPKPAVMLGQGEQVEIERLRKTAAELREQLADRKSHEPAKANAISPAAPVLLAVGKAVSVFDLAYAGNATPEAALQSLLAFNREGDLDGILQVALFPPSQAKDLEEMLGSNEHRQLFAEQMRKSILGVVVSESVEEKGDGSTSDPVVKEVWPENPSGDVTVEMLQKEQIDEKRMRISAKIVRGFENKTETYTFGLTKAGWKHIMI